MEQRAAGVPFNPFALWLKALGTLGDPATRQGKVFKAVEGKSTGLFMKLASNRFFLNTMGRQLELGFMLRSQLNMNMEMLLKLWRLPTTSDVDDIREQILDLRGEIEALAHQLEYLVEHMQAPSARTGREGMVREGTVIALPVEPREHRATKASKQADKREEG